MPRTVLPIVSHGLRLAAGFAAGVYALPILMALDSPTAAAPEAGTVVRCEAFSEFITAAEYR